MFLRNNTSISNYFLFFFIDEPNKIFPIPFIYFPSFFFLPLQPTDALLEKILSIRKLREKNAPYFCYNNIIISIFVSLEYFQSENII